MASEEKDKKKGKGRKKRKFDAQGPAAEPTVSGATEREAAEPPASGETERQGAEPLVSGATERKSAAEPEQEEVHDRAPCPVVGVGASAGGLEALQGLLAGLPADLNVAFVIVQHRASDRTDVMQSLLEKHTKFYVRDIQDGLPIEPGTIYLAPAEKDVSILNGVLYLVGPPPHLGVHLPIDAFFRALARDEVERAIGIVLSGTGSDGTLGIKDIKAAGGVVMAQKEDQAKYDSMPRSAIDTGMVDFILPVEKMGEQLAHYIRHPYLEPSKAPEPQEKFEAQLQKVFLLIRNETGHDFSHYKRNTIRRRIARRLAVHQIEDLDHYIRLLQENPDEIGILAREMLITVTNFFRDREAWESLAEQVIRPLMQQKPPAVPLRIWVAGCATGEEAYSVAILCHEHIDRRDRHRLLQVFATDLDEESINIGRRGSYPKSIAADVSPERLKRFFVEEGNSYKIRTAVRENIVFARHNLIKDAPFSKLDLVCCRNVLIYMDSVLQKKLMPMFHYTLNRGGHLFLGESESIGTSADLFKPVDARHKIFRRKPIETGYQPEAQDVEHVLHQETAHPKPRADKPSHDLAAIAERMILRDYSLPCVLVDNEFNIVYFNGDTSRFLAQPSGRPTSNIIQMARPEIHFKLNLLLKRAFYERNVTVEKDILLRVNDHYEEADIVARPVAETRAGDNLMLIVFKSRPKESKPGEGEPSATERPQEEQETRERELEQELQSTKEYLQTTIEELETSNEELKSSNEELQSTNEELQSTNEELDTSREELQSTNEELRTVNAEHQMKIDELSGAYDDMNNLLGSTEVATLFLDRDLKIRRFTPPARKLFRLIARDVGRPLADISTNLQNENLLPDIHGVLETLTRVDREVQSAGGEWYQVKVIPYRTAENVIDGVVLTFVDITGHKKMLDIAERAGEFAEAVVETVRQPLLILNGHLKVVATNPAFFRHFQTEKSETLGKQIYELGHNQWDLPELRELLEHIVPENTRFEDFRVEAEFPRIGRRTMLLNARQTTHKGEVTGRILLAFEDVTDRAKKE